MLADVPAPVVVDGLPAVPMHIRRLTAEVVLDAKARRGYVDAVMSYRVGPASGCPLFDLRQPIDEAWLDGCPIAPAGLRPRETGEGRQASVRVVEQWQSARSSHTLRFRYRLGEPHADLGGAYPPALSACGRGRVRWSFGMGDLFDGRHLEMWFPSNLPFDQFPFELTLVLIGAEAEHSLITNGTVTARGAHAWHLAFPAWFSSVCAMLEVRPTDELEHARVGAVLGSSGRSVPVDVWKTRDRPENLLQEAARVARMLDCGESMFGPFPGHRYTCFFHGAEGGMEYAGATTTSASALWHEVLHSWFARGVLPATDADGWWDEAFTTFVTRGAVPGALDFGRPPVELCSRRPFQRHTDAAAYDEGSRLFTGLAAMIGPAALMRSMAMLYRTRSRSCLSTAELEEHLVRGTGVVGTVDAFHRFVYGFDDPRRASGVRLDRVWATDTPDGRRWMCAEVRNDHGAAPCRHFLVLLSVRAAGPAPASSNWVRVAAVAGFDLLPGEARVVRAHAPRWMHASGETTDVDVLAGVHVRLAHPSGRPTDYRERTMMLTRVRQAAGSGVPEPAVWIAR